MSPFRTRICSLTVAALALAASFTAWAQAPIVIQFSHVVAADTAKGKGALRFKELAEARTAGRVKVEVFANSTLYKDREELEALRLGAVQMLAPSLSKLASLGGGDFEVFDLPFLFRDRAAFRAVANGPTGAALLHKLESRGIKGLAYWDNGFKDFTSNRPLRKPADFQGLRVRVQASRVSTAQMRAVGAEPRVTPLSDVYADLKDGLLDGEEGVPSNIHSQRLHEMQKHLTVSNHGYLAYAVIVNKAFWDGLPAELRVKLEGALRDASSYTNSLAESENARALERIKASGKVQVYTLSADEQAQWRAAMAGVYGEASAWINPQTLNAIKAAAGP
jgi:C4-dicarboxylate-binding protein DctP